MLKTITTAKAVVAAVEEARRRRPIVLAHPDEVDAVRDAVAELGLDKAVTVTPNAHAPRGSILVTTPAALLANAVVR